MYDFAYFQQIDSYYYSLLLSSCRVRKITLQFLILAGKEEISEKCTSLSAYFMLNGVDTGGLSLLAAVLPSVVCILNFVRYDGGIGNSLRPPNA